MEEGDLMNASDVAVGIVALSDGEFIGRTRLQKTVYLLDLAGMKSGLAFDYHNYGPFSAELAEAWDEADRSGRLEIGEKAGFHEVPYTIFKTKEGAPKKLGGLSSRKATELLEVLKPYSAVVLELAATIAFLREDQFPGDVIEEVRTLKPLKATPERLRQAEHLLRELGLGKMASATT